MRILANSEDTGKSGKRRKDIPRRVAVDTLLRVSQTASFANLILPKELTKQGVTGQDAAFVTDAVYGTLRWRGLLDAIITAAAKRPPEKIDSIALEILRLGVFEVLFMEVPDYAAVSSSVDLIRDKGRGRLSGFVNAVIRTVSKRNRREWESIVVSRIPKDEPIKRLTVRYSHPEWIVSEFQKSWDAAGYEEQAASAGSALSDILDADNRAAEVTLIARPGLISREDLRSQLPADADVRDGLWSPYAVRVKGVHPGTLPAVAAAQAGVEDEGSQLAALALAAAPAPTATTHRWLDLCAGPGGKTALLGALAAQTGATLVANEPSLHRAQLVRENVAGLPSDVIEKVATLDGREWGSHEPASFDRVLVDAPCSGVGALRRRPEARWVKSPDDIVLLAEIQKELLRSALKAVCPGGVVAYVTCSPVLAETRDIVESVLGEADGSGAMNGSKNAAKGGESHPEYRVLNVPEVLRSVSPDLPLPVKGDFVQLFSSLHDTDQMFIALIQRVA